MKRLVDAGIVKASVYDQLVGANARESQITSAPPASGNNGEKEGSASISEDGSKKFGSGSSDRGTTDPGKDAVDHSDDRLSRIPSHSRAQTTPVVSVKRPLVSSPASPDAASGLGQRHKPTRSMGAMLSRLLTGLKLSRHSGQDSQSTNPNSKRKAPSLSPLDLRVVAPAMLNYKVTLTHTEKAADLQGNLYTLFVASVEYNDETIGRHG